MLLGSDAFGVETEDSVADGNEVRPWEAKVDPVARSVELALGAAPTEDCFDRVVEGCCDVDVIRCDEKSQAAIRKCEVD